MNRIIKIKGIHSFEKVKLDQIKAHWLQGIQQIKINVLEHNLKIKRINADMTEVFQNLTR